MDPHNWISLVLRMTSFMTMCILIYLIRSYNQNRSPTKISLSNLINADAAVSYAAAMASLIILYSLTELNVKLPPLLASLIILARSVLLTILFLYVTAASLVQYLHAHYMRTSITDRITDNEMRVLVRIAVVSSSLMLQGLVLFCDGESPVYFNLVHQDDINGVRLTNVRGVVLNLLMLLASVSNFVLRIAIRTKQRRNNLVLSVKAYESLRSRTILHLAFVLVFLCGPMPLVVFNFVFEPSSHTRRWSLNVLIFNFMVVLPCTYIVNNGKLRNYACGKVAKMLKHFKLSKGGKKKMNKVHPLMKLNQRP